MPSKYQEYRQMADTAERQLTSSYKSWTQFLRTAARLYKYPYNEQVMIHAQRPDATACAEYDFWNKKMGRFIRRGSTGIALIDTSGQKPQLRYVFDVADTGEREHSRPVHLWRFRAEHEDIVAATLERSYDVSVSDGIVEQMESAATQLAKEYWADHKRDILHNIDDSYLDGYDEFNTEVQFRNAAKVSITYMLMSRCRLEPEAYLEPEDFMPVFDFNTPAAVAALGTAVSEISQQVLRQIEVAIRNYERERSQNHDRIDLHEERRLPDSQPEAERGTGEHALGQVRDAAEDLPSGASPHPLEPDDPVRDAVPAPAGDRRDGATETGADDAGADEVGRRDGESENQRPDEMGRADERLQGAGRRNHSERAGVQLTNDAPEVEPVQPTAAYQMSLFPTEEEQIAYIDTAESVNSTPSAFSMFISQDDIDHILRTGGNADDARMKIVAEFSKQKPIEDRAAFLKNLYYGGNGLITENGRFSAWYGDDGIHIANGDAARHLRSAQVISWADAAERIEALLDDGKFATDLEVTEAPRYERLGIAVDVWNLYHDFSDEAKSLGYLSCLGNIHSTSFPEETERLTDDLLNAAFRDRLLSEYKVFMDAYRENRALLRFHYHKPQALLTRLEDLFLPRKEFRSDMVAVPATGRFITGDEIAASLANGSGFEGGKARIYEFFQTPHTPKESADFLKKEYGIGGRTHAVSRESGSYEDHGSKGITLRKAGCADVQMNWSKVASRISELIRMNRYLTPDEQTVYDKAMAQDALRNAVYNDYNDVKAAYPDEIVLYQVGDFFELYGEDARAVADDLSLELTRRNLEGVGRVTMCGFPAKDLEKYVEKLREKHDVTISRIGDSNHKHTAYTLPSIDHEAENAINAHEAEFGADGTRVFRDPTEDTPQPTVQERLEHYRPVVMAAVSEDTAYRNACGHSDRENAEIECNAAVRRAVLNSKDMELIRLFSDMPEFRSRLHRETFEGTYARLHDLLRPLSQDDIDDALRAWNGNVESKHAVVRYMEQHGREKETAAWLAHEYGGKEGNNLFIVRAGSPETVELTWPKVQRRIAQLIREDKFFTEQEKSLLENNPDYRLLGRLRADCEYFLGAGNRAEKHLWAGSVYAQIVKMRELYDALPQKPEWLTKEMIDDYAERMAPRYQVVAYHHFENGFDEKLDYQTLEEAEKAAQGYVDGTMESDGFAYDGAAIYDQQARKYLRIYGNYPDERAHAEVAGRELVEELAASMESTIVPADRFHVVSLDRGFRTLYAVWDDETHGYYVDADGVTEEFTSEWQAEAYRLELQGQAEQALMERAKGLISDFCQSEYGSEADFSDPAKIGIAYTTVTDDEIPIQANIDLVNFRLERYLNDEHLETRQYSSLQELVSNELESLDFSDLIHVSDEDVEQHRWLAPEEAVEEAPETAPVPQREPFPYSVGDTVYLENGKPYIIESIGVFDITLSDPTLFYPISRAESRESFARLMERYPQPEQAPTYTEETMAVYPGDKNNLPYDVEIRTLRFDEPEHDPPSAEPAKPEPPAMSEEEALILEQEGRAALSEMGEFVPDFDDAISQAEIDEPPAHRPAVSIPVDGEWQGFPSVAAAEQAAYADFKAESHRNAQNFHITDDALGVGGAKAKFRANMAAIHLLQELEFEGLQASPEQQEILSRYVGWGGLADAFDENKPNWSDEFAELYATLSPEEYAAARASTLNAHYTSLTVIKAIYEAVGNMGFQTGNILEPSMGVGNFFGLLPEPMQGSKLYGVELDSITGRIAKQLYPKADITIAGFETTDRKDFYDLAVGNVPFGQYQVDDRAYNKLGFSIHDYFFAKTLDQVRPGGVIAFVTSRYTMDKQSPEVRRYIAQRAELLGAIRLPNNAFRANAGTDVVSDIIFLQRRDRPIEIDEDWIHLGQSENGFAINSYFAEHPEMVLGTPSSESTQYGKQDYTVNPIEGADLGTLLHEAVQNIGGKYQEAELPDLGENEKIGTSIPADPNVKNFSYTIVDGDVYYRENSVMVKPDLNATAKARVKGMVQLRDCVQKLIGQQLDGFVSDEAIQRTQQELDALYDSFTEKYGLINTRANNLAFSDDSSYFLLCSLEVLDEENNLKRKADIFTKRTIRPHEAITSVDTASEALALSISEKACVDMDYMAQLSGKSQEELIDELNGVIFLDPVHGEWQTADEYLSGDVRQKLREAEAAAKDSPGYLPNVEALRQAQPKDLDASEIEVRLGATWIDKAYIKQFMFELLEPAFYVRRSIDVNYSDFSAEWNITGKSIVGRSDINANMTYGTERANAYKILEDTLNLRDVRIYDTITDADGKEKRVLNSKETTLAQQKQQAIKDAFQEWIWKDPTRRHELVQKYNELFNATRPREYNGQHITFSGMNPEIQLREHQLNAVAHILYGGNTLLAHEVGAGKTFEMVAAAMESKRLGLCHKPMFVVPNHLIEQWASEFLRLYPSANILAVTKKDFEPRNRKKFCARIATGDYDAVIIGHSQFERIPVSRERQERMLQEQIYEIEDGLMELRANNAERFTIKSLEKTKKSLEVKLKKLQDTSRKDDVITFEQLGVDRLYVDEAHAFKNLFLYTKMRNVAGLSTSDAQKSSDMLLKCRYIDEITGNKGIVFATGTPVSNSMTELYTMMRYLQHDMLQRKHLTHFDCWASTFGETATAIELAPEGTGYRARTRFSKFFNLPELMQLFKEAADIKTADQLHLPTPTPIYHNVVAQPTEIQKGMVQELSERAAKVHAGIVDASTDNMLKITSDGRKLGLDQRVINPDLPDEAGSKVNLCVDNIYSVWKDGQADKLTQLVFCDLSTPKAAVPASRAAKAAGGNLDSPELHALEAAIGQDTAEEPAFTIYDDIREKLVARGIPREQIAFIHEANTEVRKKELFAKVRAGQVRVLMGSTFKMGAGMNVQDRLVALHDLDCPWRPGDLEQRSGRIIRQGNRNKEVHIYRYVTESTFDAYLWQTVENKQKFISQIMTSKSPVRSCEDVDETALSYAEIKALCAGDERIKEKMDLDVDVARLKLMKASHQSQQYKLEDSLLKKFPEDIEKSRGFISGLEADMKTLAAHPHPEDGFAGMTVKNDNLTDKDNAGAALLEAFKDVRGMEPVPIGTYRGFQMSLTLEDFGKDYVLTLKGQMTHRVTLGKDARGNLTRIDNVLNAMPDRLQNVRNTLDATTAQMEAAKAELGKPFPQEEELRVKSARLAELNAELNIDERTPMEQLADDAAISAKAERPSVLARLKNTPTRQTQDTPGKQREQESR
jgi:N12 class adenine-specific DNA methylase